MNKDKILLVDSWKNELLTEFSMPYMESLKAFIKKEKRQGKTIFPPSQQWFAAMNYTPLEKVRVVVIGQDPYHGQNQAHGLCFSVPSGIKRPPSLGNIIKEIKADLGIESKAIPPNYGNLSSWAEQGVLLLNAVLTVESGRAGSHQGRGWETFTDSIVMLLNKNFEKLVFLLWGGYAQRKGEHIDRNKHLVLQSTHPSPLSAHRGFMGCKHFSKCNKYLLENKQLPIDWAQIQ